MYFAAVALCEATKSYDRLYDYRLSDADSLKAQPGMRVLIPFGRSNKLQSGWIVRIKEDNSNGKLKEIFRIVDEVSLLSPDMVKLAEWMKTRYFCTWSDAIRIMLPAGINLKRQKHITVVQNKDCNNLNDLNELNDEQKKLFDKLKERLEGCSVQELNLCEEDENNLQILSQKGLIKIKENFNQRINAKSVKAVVPSIEKNEFECLVDEGKVKSIYAIRAMEAIFSEELCTLQDLLLIAGVTHSTIRTMAKKGWVSYCEVEVERDPFSTCDFEYIEPPKLTYEQEEVLNVAKPLLNEGKLNEILLHGVTGSGKTEVYLRLIEATIKLGKTAIALVPEISLTPQMTSRFKSRLGNRVAIQHSRLSQGERYDQWRKIMSGEVDVVIGARSAVFAPLSNLGIIILDEEHELSYKSENTPKYDARHVARARCNIHGALLVMGSATPSIESYYRAINGKIRLLTMKSRPNSMPLPQVDLVDLREELKEGNRKIISRRLEEELLKTKENGDQSILFLNRRGYASFLLCRDCGFVLKCPQCSVSLTVHKHDSMSICHYCGFTMRIPDKCPSCESSNIKDFGTGTQRVEEELKGHEVGFRIIRMDLDTTGGKHGHQKLLDKFRQKDADILIGTQMVAKGHDFPDVTLVGILAADASLFNNDYRASERTFQLITQASGRAGRGGKIGRVILQAYNVDDYSIECAMSQDYEAFYKKEINMRLKLNAPPFCHIGLIVVSSENAKDARESMERIKINILSNYQKESGYQCSEILPSPIFVIRNRSRWRIIIKMSSINSMVKLMNEVIDSFSKLRVKGTDLSVDIDPSGMV